MKRKHTRKIWILFRDGVPSNWFMAKSTRAEAIREAVQGTIPARDYESLGNDSARWKKAKSYGFRLKRCNVTVEWEE